MFTADLHSYKNVFHPYNFGYTALQDMPNIVSPPSMRPLPDTMALSSPFSAIDQAGDVFSNHGSSYTPSSSVTGPSDPPREHQSSPHNMSAGISTTTQIGLLRKQSPTDWQPPSDLSDQFPRWTSARGLFEESAIANDTFYETQPFVEQIRVSPVWTNGELITDSVYRPDMQIQSPFHSSTLVRRRLSPEIAQSYSDTFSDLPELDDSGEIETPISAITNDSLSGFQQVPLVPQERTNSSNGVHDDTDSNSGVLPTPCRNGLGKLCQVGREKDVALLKLRDAGMTYKQIKAKLGLVEAESTLRGRHRTLKKSRADRPRRPAWPSEAVSNSL